MTISFNRLGNDGRLGNQMFQYAFLRGVAKNRDFDWMIPGDDDYSRHNYGLFDCFEMTGVKPENIGRTTNRTVECFDTTFQENIFNNCTTNTDFLGTFQTEKYFENATEEIRKDFTFKKGYLEPCKEYIESLDKPPIFLHVRQSDNIGREQYHPILPISFFDECLKEFPDDTPCFVFTDDLAWCKSQDYFKQDRFLFNENVERYNYRTIDGLGKMQNTLLPQVDLCLMSLCSGAIIANSSFSWWGAWLQNDSGKIIAPDPKKWFGSAMTHLDTSDIVPDRWIIKEWSK